MLSGPSFWQRRQGWQQVGVYSVQVFSHSLSIHTLGPNRCQIECKMNWWQGKRVLRVATGTVGKFSTKNHKLLRGTLLVDLNRLH